MNRYLINLSYIGTAFRGMQKTIRRSNPVSTDTNSIQGLLELGLQKLRPVNEVHVVLSSRTDAGVHAIQNSVHVDLESPYGELYAPDNITSLLNRQFCEQGYQIRILNTIHVPDTFHSRYNAKARTYLYRVAVAREKLLTTHTDRRIGYLSFLPIEEYERCLFVQNNDFDIEAFKDAAQLFVGLHDFRTFMNSNKNNLKQSRPNFGIRLIKSIDVQPGRACSIRSNMSTKVRCAENFYDYWDVFITGKSFLHNQVRRMIGSMIAVATNRITKKDIYEMLTIPSKFTWNTKITVVPPYGLYLCKVHYDKKDLQFPLNEKESECVVKSC